MAFNQFPVKGGIPSGNTAGRPGGPVIGDTYYNGQLGLLEIYDGTNWIPNSAPPGIPAMTATDIGTGRAFASGALNLTFTASANGGAALGYGGAAVLGASTYSTGNTSSTTATLAVGGPGSYSVTSTAFNGFGASPSSVPISVAVTTVPETPTIGTATASGSANEIAVTWTNGTSGGKNISAITITPYLNGTTAQTSQTAATTSSTSFTFTTAMIPGNQAYTFKVKATNANGVGLESAASNSATMPARMGTINFLVLAGGGCGGNGATVSSNRAGGGGGAGGFRSSISPTGGGLSAESAITGLSFSTNYTVTVGAGGASGGIGTQGANGSNSVFNTITSTGGGGGGAGGGQNNGSGGGSGGGGSQGGSGAAGTSGQGYAGGNSSSGNLGGGGGGAGANGALDSNTSARTAGVSNNITGSSVTYAEGGFFVSSGPWTPGPANSGYGGMGGYNDENPGGPGGSGVVILRYPDTHTITIGSGLTGTESAASGGFKRATITAGTGNVSWV
jgi:hypothetical protein